MLLISAAVIMRSISYAHFCFGEHLYMPAVAMIILIICASGLILAGLI